MKVIKLFPNVTRRSLVAAGNCALVIGALAIAGCGAGPANAGASPAVLHSTLTASHGAPVTFQVLSMTFVSDQQGFALGTVKCGSSRCGALLGTANGGTTWRQLTAPTKRVGQAYNTCVTSKPCVGQVRFATPLIGYAFDPSLFLTTDGGLRWRQLPGPTVNSLEVADGTAIRVASGSRGCAGQPFKVQSSAIGTGTWSTLPQPPGIAMICPPTLYRQHQRLVVVGYGNPAGGVRATANIAGSANGGASWQHLTDQCGGRSGYAEQVAIAPPDVLVLLCRNQIPNSSNNFGAPWVRVSTNGGVSYGPDRTVTAPHGLPTKTAISYQVAAASASRLVVVGTGPHGSDAYVSQNGGRSWSVRLKTQSSAQIILVGFEDPLTARIAQGDQVWTTTDGGQSWIVDRFPN
jgi:hypothetical protein